MRGLRTDALIGALGLACMVPMAASEGMTLDLEPLPVPEPVALPGNRVILRYHTVHNNGYSSGMLHGTQTSFPASGVGRIRC